MKKLVFPLLFLSLLLFFMCHNFHTKKTIIAVLDTGISETTTINKEKILNGFNVIHPFQKPIDKNGHGTKMAEIIHQMSPDNEILPVKVISDQNKINHPFLSLGILYSILKGADVVNMSFSYTPKDFMTSIMIKIGEAKGVVFVAAAGNEGKKTVDFPANQKGVISVGSYDKISKKISDFSNYGSKIDVFAPSDDTPAVPGEGTSMSAAFVTGIVADMMKNGIKKENIQKELTRSSDFLTQKTIRFKAINTDLAYAEYMHVPYMEVRKYNSFSTNPYKVLKIKTENLDKMDVRINNKKLKALSMRNNLLISLTYGVNNIRLTGYGLNNLKAEANAFILYDPKPPEIKYEYNVKDGTKYVLLTIRDLSLRKVEVNGKDVVPFFLEQDDGETSYSYQMKYEKGITVQAEDSSGNKSMLKI